jgi:hypothetical protein
MKTKTFLQRLRPHGFAILFITGLLSLLAGCVTQRIVWSPDGKQAAVLAEDGLYLCDGEGHLSGLLLSNASIVAWFKDSQRMVIGQLETCTNWNRLAAALDPAMRDAIRRQATNLLARLEAGDAQQVLESESRLDSKELLAARVLCLREEHAAASLKVLTGDPKLEKPEVQLSTLLVARAVNGRLEIGPILAVEIGSIWDLRLSPGNDALAYTTRLGEGRAHLSVIGLSGKLPAQIVARHAAVYPDWSPDGRSLVYIAPANTNSGDGDITLGALTRREVVNEKGQIEIQKTTEELAGVMFNDLTRVRCLQDGRILFSSEEWRLPVTTNDLPQRQQLFALDPARQSTLTALVPHGTHEMLPANLNYFEVSPDEKRIAFGGDKGMVAVFALSSGNVEVVQNGTEDTGLKSIPSWRSAAELCYIAIQDAGTNRHKAEVALWQAGKTNILSRNWPEPVRKGWLD